MSFNDTPSYSFHLFLFDGSNQLTGLNKKVNKVYETLAVTLFLKFLNLDYYILEFFNSIHICDVRMPVCFVADDIVIFETFYVCLVLVE